MHFLRCLRHCLIHALSFSTICKGILAHVVPVPREVPIGAGPWLSTCTATIDTSKLAEEALNRDVPFFMWNILLERIQAQGSPG
jgi:hypothetical protein